MSTPHDEFSRVVAADLAALLEQVAAEDGPAPDSTLLSPADGRRLSDGLNRRWNRDLPGMASLREITVPADPGLGSADTRLKILLPAAAARGAILYLHGGGFAFGSPETHERCARVLALESGLPVALPDYRLAPEHPFPAGLLDCVACLRALFAATAGSGAEPVPVLVAGDSAGANLALAAMLHEQREGGLLPAGGLLFYGNYDTDFETPSYRYFSDGPGLTRAKMQRYWSWYAPNDATRHDPIVAPLRASDAELRALPPLYLLAAGIDPSLSDSLNLAARLNRLGRPEAVQVVPGVTHGFLQMTGALPAAREALAAAGAAAREMIRAA